MGRREIPQRRERYQPATVPGATCAPGGEDDHRQPEEVDDVDGGRAARGHQRIEGRRNQRCGDLVALVGGRLVEFGAQRVESVGELLDRPRCLRARRHGEGHPAEALHVEVRCRTRPLADPFGSGHGERTMVAGGAGR
jgi:hypothetical protein